MISESDVRKKFEAWAVSQGHNLTRHPNNSDFYYARDVSMLWVCYLTAYNLGRLDENSSLFDGETGVSNAQEASTTMQTALIERTIGQDD